MLVGLNVAEVLLDFARSRNVTKIVAGKTAQPSWKRWFVSTVVDQLLNRSGDIDVYVVSGEGEAPLPNRKPTAPTSIRWYEYLKAAALVATCGLIAGCRACGEVVRRKCCNDLLGGRCVCVRRVLAAVPPSPQRSQVCLSLISSLWLRVCHFQSPIPNT